MFQQRFLFLVRVFVPMLLMTLLLFQCCPLSATILLPHVWSWTWTPLKSVIIRAKPWPAYLLNIMLNIEGRIVPPRYSFQRCCEDSDNQQPQERFSGIKWQMKALCPSETSSRAIKFSAESCWSVSILSLADWLQHQFACDQHLKSQFLLYNNFF